MATTDIPYLFAMIMDVLACRIKDILPWRMLHADDIVGLLCGTRSEVVENKLEEGGGVWKTEG